jgi:hypothetical protein
LRPLSQTAKSSAVRWRCAKSTLRPNDLGASKGLLLANRLSPQFWRRTGVPLIIRPPV